MKLTYLFTISFLLTSSLVLGQQVQQPINAEIFLEANQEILFSEIDTSSFSDIMMESDSLKVKVLLELENIENISKISCNLSNYSKEFLWSQLNNFIIDNTVLIDLGVFPYAENFSVDVVIYNLTGESSVPATYQSIY